MFRCRPCILRSMVARHLTHEHQAFKWNIRIDQIQVNRAVPSGPVSITKVLRFDARRQVVVSNDAWLQWHVTDGRSDEHHFDICRSCTVDHSCRTALGQTDVFVALRTVQRASLNPRVRKFPFLAVTYSEKTFNANKLLPGLIIVHEVIGGWLVALGFRGKDGRTQSSVFFLDLYHVQLSNARKLTNNSTCRYSGNHIEHFVNLAPQLACWKTT